MTPFIVYTQKKLLDMYVRCMHIAQLAYSASDVANSPVANCVIIVTHHAVDVRRESVRIGGLWPDQTEQPYILLDKVLTLIKLFGNY